VDILAERLVRKHAQELRDMWQARALAEARGRTAAVLLSVLAHNYDEVMPTLLRVVFPGFSSITAPFLTSAGRVSKTGAIVADVVDRHGKITKRSPLYPSEFALRDDFRRLADRLKLSDADRMEMFEAIKRWVVCDYRLDPAFDPKDPDAKRLVVH
jgi:hypothetical protein